MEWGGVDWGVVSVIDTLTEKARMIAAHFHLQPHSLRSAHMQDMES